MIKTEEKREVDQERERLVVGGSWTMRSVMGDEIETTRLVKQRQASGDDKIKTTRV